MSDICRDLRKHSSAEAGRLRQLGGLCPPGAVKRLPRSTGRAAHARGFTLIELMVVVVLIAILSSIAVPGIARRMKSYRAKRVSEEIAALYREARLRAMGRGSAILVRYDGAGGFEVREAIQGTAATAGCERLPETSCLFPSTRWGGNARSQLLSLSDFAASGDYTIVANFLNTVTLAAATGALDVCFSPMGRTYNNSSGNLAEMTAPMRIDVSRTDNVSFDRAVMVSPMGTARVVVNTP